MTKKKLLKEKQKLKKEAKAQREEIIKSYMSKIQDVLDNGYIEINQAIEDFNAKLVKATSEYDNLKKDLILFIKDDNKNIDALEEITQKAIDFENSNTELYLTIASRKISENKILQLLKEISDRVGDVVEEAKNSLDGQKNDFYILSIIVNRCYAQFDNYNEYINDIALESNCYIDAYINTRQEFIEYITELKNNAELTLQNEETEKAIKEIDSNIKYKERLRVSYYELENFLIFKGYAPNRQNSTTHAIWKHKETGASVTVPNKSRTVPQGTVSRILRQIGSSRQELAQYLYS